MSAALKPVETETSLWDRLRAEAAAAAEAEPAPSDGTEKPPVARVGRAGPAGVGLVGPVTFMDEGSLSSRTIAMRRSPFG